MTPTENITVGFYGKVDRRAVNTFSDGQTDIWLRWIRSLTVKILTQQLDWFSFDEANTLALEFMSYSSTHCFLKTTGIQSPTLSPLHTIKRIWIHRERAGLQNSWPLLQSHTPIWFHWDADVTGKENMSLNFQKNMLWYWPEYETIFLLIESVGQKTEKTHCHSCQGVAMNF